MRREVDPIDLTLIELLRRFKPDVYEIVARNSVVLTGGESWLRGGGYHYEEERKTLLKHLGDDLVKAAEDEAQLAHIRAILGELFPRFAKGENFTWSACPKRKENVEDDNRISDSGMFPAYFRYELPSAIFSTVELETFIQKGMQAASEMERHDLFLDELHSMEKVL
ncbi:MAG: NTPase [Edaphobacter sp.]|nr:NTPase [Edaphobacter sp.]